VACLTRGSTGTESSEAAREQLQVNHGVECVVVDKRQSSLRKGGSASQAEKGDGEA